MDGLKTIKISGFDLPLDAKVDSKYYSKENDSKIYFNKGKEKITNREAIKEIISYISKNYINLKNIEINLGNELLFKNGEQKNFGNLQYQIIYN